MSSKPFGSSKSKENRSFMRFFLFMYELNIIIRSISENVKREIDTVLKSNVRLSMMGDTFLKKGLGS